MDFLQFVLEDRDVAVVNGEALDLVGIGWVEGLFFGCPIGDVFFDELDDVWDGRHRVREAEDVRDVPE